jgi:hypothetical protein
MIHEILLLYTNKSSCQIFSTKSNETSYSTKSTPNGGTLMAKTVF